MWDKLIQGFIYFGMPVVTAYHLICSNVFLNTAAEDATGLEKAGNILLSPMHYVFAGKVASLEEGQYHFQQRFDYQNHYPLKSTASILSLPLALPLGSLVKGIGYFSSSTRERHHHLVTSLESKQVASNLDYYQSLGLNISTPMEFIAPPEHKRRPGDENVLPHEKELLRNIVKIFKEKNIPFWIDCGTCLGAYRYGGAIPWDIDVDLAVLLPDFDNVMRALNELDKTKYHVQDWSNRSRPKTYVRVYIPENRNHLDIYFFKIDPKEKTLTFVLSNEVSSFMADTWKIRESRFKVPTAFDTIFPLKKANFDGIEVYVPNQTKKYLQERYGEDIGPVRIYNDETKTYEKDLSHPYWKLPHVYS